MTDNNFLITASFTISTAQYNWIAAQAKKRILSKSVLIREAIDLLKKEYDNGKDKISTN